MSFGKKSLSCLLFLLFVTFGAIKPLPAQQQNLIDFDLNDIINCNPSEGIDFDDPLFQFICTNLLDVLLDQLVQSEEFLDQVFVGYREDMPRFLRTRLDGTPVLIRVRMVEEDGPGNVLGFVQPGLDTRLNFIPHPFVQNRGLRPWSITRLSTINLDFEDIIFLILTDDLVDTVVHEALHSMGHPNNFELARLNRPINVFGQVHFVGDSTGIDRVGFGLSQFRNESGNPFATYVPLSQNDGSGHLSVFEPTFNRPDDFIQEAFLPFASPPGVQDFMSRSIRGMFADMGFLIRGINAPGIIDIDLDGINDEPLIIRPALPTNP